MHVCVCMCACICVYECLCTYMNLCVSICVSFCVYLSVYVYVCDFMFVYMCLCVHMCVYGRVCMCACGHTKNGYHPLLLFALFLRQDLSVIWNSLNFSEWLVKNSCDPGHPGLHLRWSYRSEPLYQAAR